MVVILTEVAEQTEVTIRQDQATEDLEIPGTEDRVIRILIGETEHNNLNKTILGEMITEASKDRITTEVSDQEVLVTETHQAVEDLDLPEEDIPVAVDLEQEEDNLKLRLK